MLGIDIGGSGIKGAIVDLEAGELVGERHRIKTPQPSTPKRVAKTVRTLVEHFEWTQPFGCALPAIMRHGVAYSAANIDDAWIGTSAEEIFGEATGLGVKVINDADAAGVAEMHYGAGRGEDGVVLLLTFGTGIGSALFLNHQLVPNTELGHLEFHGSDAEHYASANVRKSKKLSLKKWAKRVDEYLDHLDFLLSPDLFIVGGGISREFDAFRQQLSVRTRVVAAELRNQAGIVGAAHHAAGAQWPAK